MDEHVCYTEVDGEMVKVFETPEKKQYYVDKDGKKVWGIYYIPRNEDAPIIVDDTPF